MSIHGKEPEQRCEEDEEGEEGCDLAALQHLMYDHTFPAHCWYSQAALDLQVTQ